MVHTALLRKLLQSLCFLSLLFGFFSAIKNQQFALVYLNLSWCPLVFILVCSLCLLKFPSLLLVLSKLRFMTLNTSSISSGFEKLIFHPFFPFLQVPLSFCHLLISVHSFKTCSSHLTSACMCLVLSIFLYISPHFSSSLIFRILRLSSLLIYAFVNNCHFSFSSFLSYSIHFFSSFSLTHAFVSPWALSWLQSWFVYVRFHVLRLEFSTVANHQSFQVWLLRKYVHICSDMWSTRKETSNFLMDWTFQVMLRHCISCRKADTLSFFCFYSLLPIVSSCFCTPIDLCSCFFSLTLCFSCILVVSHRAFHQDSLLFGSASSSSFLFIPLIPLHSLPCSSFWSFPSSLHWTQSFRTSYRQHTNTSR